MRNRRSSFEPRWTLVFVFFIAGVFGGSLSTYLWSNSASGGIVKLHFPKGTFKYINPTLATESSDLGNANGTSKNLQLKLGSLITQSKAKGVSDAGIYYRDLDPARWIDVNANTQFSPGKLLKIPIMIAYYREAEQDPSILYEKIQYTGTYSVNTDTYAAPQTLVRGNSYSVDDLIRKMVIDSDDAAAALLFNHIDKTLLDEVFSDLGIDFTENIETQDYISIRRYSLFFRVLYNATYLSSEYSEKALSLLSESSKNSLLGKNLPNSVLLVSRTGGTDSTVYECDIVYYPGHDYLLCATATGSNMTALKNLLSDIGSAVYEDTAYRYSN